MKIGLTYSVNNQMNHAYYAPAIQSQYARGVIGTASRPLPNNASLSDLNFFKPGSRFFNLGIGLYSAGIASNKVNPPSCMVTGRKQGKNAPIVIGDSGGYQVMTKNRKLSTKEKIETFNWQVTHCDVNMTLDVPTNNMYVGKSVHFETFEDCLFGTLSNLALYKHLGAEKHKFLNVLQGQKLYHSDIWYDAVKDYDFYGYAFAGEDKTTLKLSLWRIIAMIEDGKFDRDEIWLHFLGVGDLKTAVLLTTIRDTLQVRFPHCRIHVSYDTSSPFLQGGRFLSALDKPQFSNGMLRVPSYRINKNQWINTPDDPFPFSGSKISQYLTKGDIIRRDWRGKVGPDELAYLMLQNHNVEVQVSSVDAIHQLIDNSGLTRQQLQPLVPWNLLDAQIAIEDILLNKDVERARERLLHRRTMWVLDNAYSAGHVPHPAQQPQYYLVGKSMIRLNRNALKAGVGNCRKRLSTNHGKVIKFSSLKAIAKAGGAK